MQRSALLPTKSPLDKILGGGLEKGVLTLVYGEAGSGKTTLALQAAAAVLKEEKSAKVLFVDTEFGFSPERFMQIFGKNSQAAMQRIILARPSNLVQQQDSIERSLPANPSLIVLDSLVALYRLELCRQTAMDLNRALARQLFTLAKFAANGAVVLITDQVYKKFDSGKLSLSAGDIPKYICKCIVAIERLRGPKRRFMLEKHRFMRPAAIEVAISDRGFRSGGLF